MFAPSRLPLAVVLDIPVSPTLLVAGGIVMTMLIAIPAFKGLLDIIGWFKKTPPDHERYATKLELAKLEARIEAEKKSRADDLREMEERIAASAEERNRMVTAAVARAEQRMSEINAQITHQLDQGQTLFNSLQREQASLAANIAKLAGTMEALRSAKR